MVSTFCIFAFLHFLLELIVVDLLSQKITTCGDSGLLIFIYNTGGTAAGLQFNST